MNFDHLTADEAKMLADVLASRRHPIDTKQQRKPWFLPVAAADAFLSVARADGMATPGWRIDGVRVERVAATCWDYLAAGIWAVPALVKR